jgi:hypothetical protein
MEATNQVLLREIDELKGWVIYLMRLEFDQWAQRKGLSLEDPKTREQFMAGLHEHGAAWKTKLTKRRGEGRDEVLASPSDEFEDPFPSNVTPFIRP